MPISILDTARDAWLLARSANSTASSFPSDHKPTATEPTGEGVVQCGYNHALVMPFGTDTNDQTFDLRMLGWRQIESQSGWAPIHLGTISCTVSSTLTGVSGVTPNGASDFFADTITISSGGGNLDVRQGVADTIPEAVLVDLNGARKLEIVFDMTGAASANALVAVL